MIQRNARHYLSHLLATTFLVSTATTVVAQDKAAEAPSAAENEAVPAAAGRVNQSQGQTGAQDGSIKLDTINVRGGGSKRVRPAPAAEPAAAPPVPTIPANAGGDIGYHANSTATATKTNTPLRDIPQSITVVTKQQLQDIGAQTLEDAARYVPGVSWHQGEGNRDQVVIRGISSTADFFVNGMRDDGQVYRDLYNTERVEFLKGPNAMIFGRGGGGGIINRVLKEADGIPVNEWKYQTGSFNNQRVSGDVGGKITDNVFARINGVFEDTDSYRDFYHMQRGGINPTLTWLATPLTKVKLSYEYFHDYRTADRGIPSHAGLPFFAATPNQFFGNPALSNASMTQNNVTAVVEHDFNNGLTLKSQTRYAAYSHWYQNVFAGSAISSAGTYTQAAYNNDNDRQNVFNQTDWTWKVYTGAVKHTMVFGTEVGNQKSANMRFAGMFPGTGGTSAPISAYDPTTFNNVVFPGLSSDARNKTNLDLAAVYVQDQIELTRWLQFIGGVRFDRFDLSYENLQPALLGQKFARTDNLLSPRAGLVLKPVEPLSLYTSYSVSYLPASGDQFGALTNISTALQPEKFTNKEVGVKWNVNPLLTFTTAAFELDRENTPIRDPNGTGTVLAAGHSVVKGIETGLAGYVTDQWQISAGYANLRARYVTDTASSSGALASRAGAHVQFVPTHMYSLWNRYDVNYNWGVGIGVVAQDRFYAGADNTVEVPGFTRVDGAIYWRLNQFVKAQVNIENIFGAKYYPSANSNNNITIGSPRAVRFALTTNFTGEGRTAPLWGPGPAAMFTPASRGPVGRTGDLGL